MPPRTRSRGERDSSEGDAPTAEPDAEAGGSASDDDSGAGLLDRLLPTSGPETFDVDDIQWVVLPPGGMITLDDTNALDVATVARLARSEKNLDKVMLGLDDVDVDEMAGGDDDAAESATKD